jgi:signal transduction histidine kinase
VTDADPDRSEARRLAQLERRWRREREARLESERIAESGLRRLWEAKTDLDRRVEERTAELAEARRAAEAADRAKTEFLANLSHEMGTPLQTILVALDLSTTADPHERDRIDAAQHAVHELRDLFANLLELAQIEVGTVTVTPRTVELDEVADELARRWRGPLVGRGMLLVPESAGTAEVDPDRLRQIGDALLSNAAKFGEPGTVGLRLVAEDHAVHLSVSDDGPGVDAGAFDRIFEPFVQLHGGNDRTVGGSGIGLAVVRGLATRLGGDARATTSPNGGLCIDVRVPTPEPAHTGRTA